MPEKLLTLQELSDYLGIKKEKIASLVDSGAISAYKIGGELLRFRRDQIDAIRTEIESRITDADKIEVSEARKRVKERSRSFSDMTRSTSRDKLADFFYFNDFYIVSAVLVIILMVIIIRG